MNVYARNIQKTFCSGNTLTASVYIFFSVKNVETWKSNRNVEYVRKNVFFCYNIITIINPQSHIIAGFSNKNKMKAPQQPHP